MPNKLVKDGYDLIAEDYSATRDQFKSIKYLDALNARLSPNSQVLDIGCGAGSPVDEYLVKAGHVVTGIDISERMIVLARENVPQATYHLRDMSELVQGEYRADAVVSFYAIFHIPRDTHERLLRTISSFLPDSGLLLMTMGCYEWEGKEGDFHGVEMYWSHYGKEVNRALVVRAGLEILIDEIDDSGNERHQVILASKRAPATIA